MAEVVRSDAIAADPSRAQRGPRRPRGRASGGGGPLLHAVTTLLAIGLAAAGWFIFTQQEQLERAATALSGAEQRIGRLEDRLRLTDETLSEADADTSKQLSFWESEIRKLWDIGNKRNRNWIEANRDNLGKVAANLDSAEADLAALKSAVARLDASVGEQQEVADRVMALDASLQRLVRQQRDLVDKVNAASQTAAGLKAGLEARVRENEQAISAFDAQRAQLSADIRALRVAVEDRAPQPGPPSL